jgi:hypothetical protein
MLGWYILVKNRTFGGSIGYDSGKNSSSLKFPPSLTNNVPAKGVDCGPVILTSKYRRLSSWGIAEIPGAGSAINLSVSYCDFVVYFDDSFRKCWHGLNGKEMYVLKNSFKNILLYISRFIIQWIFHSQWIKTSTTKTVRKNNWYYYYLRRCFGAGLLSSSSRSRRLLSC